MTDQEINIAIAEACGWTSFYCAGHFVCAHPPGENKSTDLPDYCADLNAMHSVEAEMLGHQMIRYQASLNEICPKDPHVSCWDLIHASARQRAEAFMRTIGKWRDA